jgi:hypothetical protein
VKDKATPIAFENSLQISTIVALILKTAFSAKTQVNVYD